jgi:hypothetical protein
MDADRFANGPPHFSDGGRSFCQHRSETVRHTCLQDAALLRAVACAGPDQRMLCDMSKERSCLVTGDIGIGRYALLFQRKADDHRFDSPGPCVWLHCITVAALYQGECLYHDYATTLLFAVYLLAVTCGKALKGARKRFVLPALAVMDFDFFVWNGRWVA